MVAIFRKINSQRTVYLFILPSLLLMAIFCYYPFFSAIYHSFTRWTIGGASNFIGFKNFLELIRDKVFLISFGNLIKLSIFAVFINVTAPLLAAEAIFSQTSVRAQYVFRALLIFPMVVPTIVIILVWGFIYDADVGIINQLLGAIGLEKHQQAWLGDEKYALYAIMGVGFPWVGGFPLLIYFSGLQNISRDILDSVTIDGAGFFRRFASIDLPMILGQIKLILILSIINSLQGFGVQLILTGGGPGYATIVPGLHMYNAAFFYARMGYASAIGFVLFILILALTYINMKSISVGGEYVPK